MLHIQESKKVFFILPVRTTIVKKIWEVGGALPRTKVLEILNSSIWAN